MVLPEKVQPAGLMNPQLVNVIPDMAIAELVLTVAWVSTSPEKSQVAPLLAVDAMVNCQGWVEEIEPLVSFKVSPERASRIKPKILGSQWILV